jgi:hypothetical protein
MNYSLQQKETVGLVCAELCFALPHYSFIVKSLVPSSVVKLALNLRLRL